MATNVEVRVQPASSKFDPNDGRWQMEVAQFARDLEAAGCDVERRAVDIEGTKGALESIVVPLVSAGALTTAVEFFRAWLARDGGRGLKLSIGADGSTEFDITGRDIDDATRQRILDAVVARLEQPSDSS